MIVQRSLVLQRLSVQNDARKKKIKLHTLKFDKAISNDAFLPIISHNHLQL